MASRVPARSRTQGTLGPVLPLVLVLPCAACGAGSGVGAVPPPQNIQGTDAVGDSCVVHDVPALSLIVDWDLQERAQLEAQMMSKLAVVAYDCKTIQLLPGCYVEGMYDYAGVEKEERVVQLENVDEIRANLPKTGARLGLSMSADLERGASLDVALVMVGRRRATRVDASMDDLYGYCEGATHFVRGAVVGAFAMNQGNQARGRSTIEIFAGRADGSSGASRVQHTTSGTPEACAAAKPGDTTPPAKCGALYGIELSALHEGQPVNLE